MAEQVAGRRISLDPRSVWRGVRQEVADTPRPLRAWFTLLAVLCLVGAIGALLSLPPGWEVLGTTPTFEWGILITAYVFFAITTSGLCLASSLGTVFGIEMFLPLEKRHAILALLSLVTAFGVIALDLHYPVRMVLGAVLSPSPTSPMWWMGVFYGVYLVFLCTEVWSMFTGHWGVHRIACTLSSITAVLAPTTLGAVFGVIAARPYWHGAFTPPMMVTEALLSGIALLGIVFALVQRFHLVGHERAATLAIPAIRLLLTIVIAVAILVVTWQTLFGLYGSVPGLSDATRALLVGPEAVYFWVFRVVLGLAVPMVLLALRRTRTSTGLFAASCLVFAGVFFDRFVFVNAGQIAPSTAVAGTVSTPYASYAPSAVEIAVVVGAFAFLALAYTLAERYLPMNEHEGHIAGVFGGTGHPADHDRLEVAAVADRVEAVGASAATPAGGAAPAAEADTTGAPAATQAPRAARAAEADAPQADPASLVAPARTAPAAPASSPDIADGGGAG